MWPARMALRYPTKFVREVCRQRLPFRPLIRGVFQITPKIRQNLQSKKIFSVFEGLQIQESGDQRQATKRLFAYTRGLPIAPQIAKIALFNCSRQRAPKQPQLSFWRPLAARLRHQIHNLATLQFHMKPNICFYIFHIYYTAFTQRSANKIESKCSWLQMVLVTSSKS